MKITFLFLAFVLCNLIGLSCVPVSEYNVSTQTENQYNQNIPDNAISFFSEEHIYLNVSLKDSINKRPPQRKSLGRSNVNSNQKKNHN